ncbi:MAG: hypothetical protein U9N59_00595 [Campylobacterota bacterium]|nr:hypothetical protein [Campylobacterota bacterium]
MIEILIGIVTLTSLILMYTYFQEKYNQNSKLPFDIKYDIR